MPITFLDEAHKRRTLAGLGYNPDEYDVDLETGSVVPSFKPIYRPPASQPSFSPPSAESIVPPSTPEKFTPAQTFSLQASRSAPPGLAALPVGIAVHNALAPAYATGAGAWIPPVAGIAAGVGTAVGLDKFVLDPLIKRFLPSYQKALQESAAEDPNIAAVGQLAGSLISGKPSVRNVISAGRTVGRLGGRAIGAELPALSRAELANLGDVAIGGAIPAGMSGYESLTEGRPLNAWDAANVAGGLLFNRLNPVGRFIGRVPGGGVGDTFDNRSVQSKYGDELGRTIEGEESIPEELARVRQMRAEEERIKDIESRPYSQEGRLLRAQEARLGRKPPEEFSPADVERRAAEQSFDVGAEDVGARIYYSDKDAKSGKYRLSTEKLATDLGKVLPEFVIKKKGQRPTLKTDVYSEDTLREFLDRKLYGDEYENYVDAKRELDSLERERKVERDYKETGEALDIKRFGNYSEEQKNIEAYNKQLRTKLAEEATAQGLKGAAKAKYIEEGLLRNPVQKPVKPISSQISEEQFKRESNYQLYKGHMKNGRFSDASKISEEGFLERYQKENLTKQDQPFETTRGEINKTQRQPAEKFEGVRSAESLKGKTFFSQESETQQAPKLVPAAESFVKGFKEAGTGNRVKATKSLYDFFTNLIGPIRNVKLERGQVLNAKGEPMAGVAVERQGLETAISKVDPERAGPETLPHELIHPYFRDMLKSPHPRDKAFAEKFVKAANESEALKKTNEILKERGLSEIDGEELLTDSSSYEVLKQLLKTDKSGNIKLAWDNLISGLKTRWLKNPRLEDFQRVLANRFLNDPSFSETHGGEGFKGGPKITEDEGVEEGESKFSEESELTPKPDDELDPLEKEILEKLNEFTKPLPELPLEGGLNNKILNRLRHEVKKVFDKKRQQPEGGLDEPGTKFSQESELLRKDKFKPDSTELKGNYAWMTPDGNFITVPGYGHHENVLDKRFPDTIGPKRTDPMDFARENGLLHVSTSLDNSIIEVFGKPNSIQRRKLKDAGIEKGREVRLFDYNTSKWETLYDPGDRFSQESETLREKGGELPNGIKNRQEQKGSDIETSYKEKSNRPFVGDNGSKRKFPNVKEGGEISKTKPESFSQESETRKLNRKGIENQLLTSAARASNKAQESQKAIRADEAQTTKNFDSLINSLVSEIVRRKPNFRGEEEYIKASAMRMILGDKAQEQLIRKYAGDEMTDEIIDKIKTENLQAEERGVELERTFKEDFDRANFKSQEYSAFKDTPPERNAQTSEVRAATSEGIKRAWEERNTNKSFTKENFFKRSYRELPFKTPLFSTDLEKLERRGGTSGKLLAPKLKEVFSKTDEYQGKTLNPSIESWTSINKSDRDIVYRALLQSRRQNRDVSAGLTSKQRAVYNEQRRLLKWKQEDQIANNQPVEEFIKGPRGGFKTVKRLPKVNENYAPEVIDGKTLDIVINHPESTAAQQLKADFIKHLEASYKMTPEEAKSMYNDLLASYGGPVPGNQTRFGAVRKSEGIGLPDSWIEQDPIIAFDRYWKRVSRDRSYHDVIEADPKMLHVLGYGRDPFGNKVKEVEGLEKISGNEYVRRTLDILQGQDIRTSPFLDAVSRLANTLILGPVTGLNDAFAAPFLMAKFAPTTGAAFSSLGSILNLSKSIKNAISTGRIKPRHSDYEDLFVPKTELVTSIRKASDLVSKVTGRADLEKLSRGISQGMAEHFIPIYKEMAKNGDKSAQKFLSNLANKEDYNKLDTKTLASRIVDLTQGTYDPRGLPTWAIDSPIAPALRLARWNIEQANNFYKHVLLPAKDGNLRPLLITLFGAGAGGLILKELREKGTNKKLAIPGLDEISASSGGLSGNIPAVLYNYVAGLSYIGALGTFGEVARAGFDIAHKNSPQGYNYPLLELVGDTTSNIARASKAILDGEDPLDVAKQFAEENLKNTTQVGRITYNYFGDAQARAEREGRRTLRVHRQLEGLPFAPQGTSEGFNPYEGISQREFKKESQPVKAVAQARELTREAFEEAKDKFPNNSIQRFTYLKKQLDSLRRNSIQTFPSPDENPEEFGEYKKFLDRLVGKNKALELMQRYLNQREVNKFKSSLIPGL